MKGGSMTESDRKLTQNESTASFRANIARKKMGA